MKDELNGNQLAFLRRGSIKKVSEFEILQITNYFSEEKKNVMPPPHKKRAAGMPVFF